MSKETNSVDRLVGNNVKFHRLARGMSQERLAGHLGISFQQVQKYEKGANRVGASRLVHIARILDVPVSALFDGAGEALSGNGEAHGSPAGLLAEPGAYRLVQAFLHINNAELQGALIALVEQIALQHVPHRASNKSQS